MWRKEGWTQEHPLTKEDFCEMAMDFCSRHSFDKPNVAARKTSLEGGSSAGVQKMPKKIRSEDEELQAALRASLDNNDDNEADDDDDNEDDEVEYVGMADSASEEPEAEPSFVQELLALNVEEEPSSGARIQIRMPDARRLVRKFSPDDTVKSIYAFVAVRFCGSDYV
jgi:TATA-binding protein-associated factor Taf7